MRRFVRPLAIAVATLGLAVGVGAGAMVPAYAGADSSFSAHVSNGPILDTYGEIDLAGTKSSGSTLTDIQDDVQNAETPQCLGTDAGSTDWTCEIDFDGTSDGMYGVSFTEQNANLTVVHNTLAFRVWDYTGADAPPNTAPNVNYVFTPGAVTVNAAISNSDLDNGVGTDIEYEGDGIAVKARCPSDNDGINGDFPVGFNPVRSLSCHTNLNAGEYSDGTWGVGPYEVTNIEGDQGEGFGPDDQNNAVIFVPYNSLSDDSAAPLSYTTDPTNRTVTITGSVGPTAFDGSRQNSDMPSGTVEILDGNDAVLCATRSYTPIARSGFDSFTCTTPTLPYGNTTLRAAIIDNGIMGPDDVASAVGNAAMDGGIYLTGAMSASTTVGTINFPAPVTNVPGTGLITPDWSFTITGDLNNLHPGDTITINGQGLPAGTTLDSVLHSIPVDLGSVVAQSDGTFTQTVVIPPDTVPGAHTIQVTASGAGLVTTTQQQAITLVPNESTGNGGGKTTNPHSGKPHTGVGNGGVREIQPNILTKALTPIADVAVHPNKIASAIEIGLVLLLLAVLPAHLLNATIAEQSDRFERRFRKIHEPRWLARFIAAIRSAPVFGGLIVAVITAILFGFADPKFGFTIASLRLVLAAGIALFLVGYVANWLTSAIARRQWHITVMVSIRPYGLILTVVGVIISRLLDFSPGFLIGLILGLTIQGKSAVGFAWRTVMTRTLIVLAMSVAAWVGYSTLTLGGNEGGTFGTELLVETFVAITTEGVVALLVELLPLRFLEGEKLYEHSRWVWGGLYFLTVVVFVLAVIPWEGNWDALGNSLWIWILVLAVFALICVGVYIYFRRFAKPLEEEAGNEEIALGEHVGRD